MKDRIRFISHKGKKILLADASNLSAEGLVNFPSWLRPGSRPNLAGQSSFWRILAARRLIRRAWRLLSQRWFLTVRISSAPPGWERRTCRKFSTST